MKIYTAPEEYVKFKCDIEVFLAGGIQKCHEWQQEVIEILKKISSNKINYHRLVVLNPKRDSFDVNAGNEEVSKQIKWEFDHLEQCDIFSMYFCNSDSVQPICMYELGRNILRMQEKYPDSWQYRLIISVEEGYSRETDVIEQVKLATNGEVEVNLHSNTESHANQIFKAYDVISGKMFYKFI